MAMPMAMVKRTLLQLVLCLLFTYLATSVDKNKFRTCQTTGFCRRNRDEVPSDHYAILPDTLKIDTEGVLTADITKQHVKPLNFEIIFLRSGGIRTRITEKMEKERYESPDVVLPPGTEQTRVEVEEKSGTKCIVKSVTPEGVTTRVRIAFHPFKLEMLVGDAKEPSIVINDANRLYFEQRKDRKHVDKASERALGSEGQAGEDEREIVDWGEDGKPIYKDDAGATDAAAGDANGDANSEEHTDANDPDAPESFGGHTDSKPHGATSIGIDISFPGSQNIYGLPEHASDFSLKDTRNGGYNEPYRLYNLDVFEYELDVPMALYGHIPMVVSHTTEKTVAAFWNNPSETYVDVWQERYGKKTFWMSETGVVDLFLFPGPTPITALKQYTRVTGTTPIPPSFALSYHQSRWNYRDEKDVAEVNANFEKYDFPYDVIWLDIEHTDGKRYFTWEKNKFKTPQNMIDGIAKYGRKMVTIVDPHIKVDNGYPLHTSATNLGYYIKNKDGSDFDGWCWPGKSSYLDFTSAPVRDFWSDQFSLANYKGSTTDLFTWNDMNEPSVFNGPEVSIPKDCVNLQGVEFRDFHNLYGFYHQWATAEGLERRNQMRSFVLSRSFYAGSQRFGAIWTGDNAAEWSHLKASIPMILSISIAGLPFIGADVGGFFNNPEEELLLRWYQTASLQPFFRAHAHIDTKRREPWLFGEENLKIIRDIVRQRYTFLPYLYTTFEEAYMNGTPVNRPMWMHYPSESHLFGIETQWLLGKDILVAPVLEKGYLTTNVYFPGGPQTKWFDVRTYQAFAGSSSSVKVDAPLWKLPVYQRGGSIVARKMRARRSSTQMLHDPLTLVVAVDTHGHASGRLYVDDERSLEYRDKQRFCEVSFVYTKAKLEGAPSCSGEYVPENVIERIIIVGEERPIRGIKIANGEELQFQQHAGVTTVRRPWLPISAPFSIHFSF